MNETEKRAFEVFGEKEKQKIAGGVKEDEAITNKQCAEPKEAISQLSEEDQIKIAGGRKPRPPKPKLPRPFYNYGCSLVWWTDALSPRIR